MIDRIKILATVSNKVFYLFLVLIFSCGQPKEGKKLIETNNNIISNDYLINEIFNYGKQYFDIKNIDSIIALKGNPIRMYKTQWCDGICDDSVLTTFEYPGLCLRFFERNSSNIEIESIDLYDKKNHFPANLTIGITTRQNILQRLGLPDTDHNAPRRRIKKSGDTTVYVTQTEAGDTVTFSYNIKIDEYAINLSMTKDTLRKVSLIKNMN